MLSVLVKRKRAISPLQKEMHKRDKCLKLFLATLKISAFTFGGGFVIIPLLRRKFVEELCWISEEEMIDLTAIAQSSPGAIAVNASILVGYRVAGLIGALVSVLGTIIPPITILSVVSLFYQAFRDNIFVNMIMAGMLCGVAAVIADVVINMLKTVFLKKGENNRLVALIMLVLAFVANWFLKVNIVVIILFCGLLGAVETVFSKKKNVEREKVK